MKPKEQGEQLQIQLSRPHNYGHFSYYILGLMCPMLFHTTAYPRSGIFGVSHFSKRGRPFSIRAPWCFSLGPASVDAQQLTRATKFPFHAKDKIKGFSYRNVSSQSLEKMESDVATKVYYEDLPVSTSYDAAMEALSSLITSTKRGGDSSNDVTSKKHGDCSSNAAKLDKLDRMKMYLKILDLEEHMAKLKIIHVAGTKGKGSTCTFCEAILRESGLKTGLFTSPHLIDVRERFRIDGLEISEDKFLLYFWDCWNRLKEQVTEDLLMPRLFQFLTVLAFKIFVSEQVDVSIIEVGLGGLRDSTNVIREPVVCGITSLGMDHMDVLGNTLGEIASHKAGIFKPQIPAFTVHQDSEAMDVLHEKAHELMVPLKVVGPLDNKMLDGLKLRLSGDHQFTNAGLAVSLCKYWLQRTGNWEKLFQNDVQEPNLAESFLRGLSTAHLSGRAEIIYDSSSKSHQSPRLAENPSGDLVFYLDGAHSPESMEVCAKWFSSAVEGNKQSSPFLPSSLGVESVNGVLGNDYLQHETRSINALNTTSKKVSVGALRILLFNCMDVRDPQILLPTLVRTCASSGTCFSKAIFVPSMSVYNKVTSGSSAIPSDISGRDLSWQFTLQRLWEKFVHGIEIEANALQDKNTGFHNVETLPSREFLLEDASRCSPADGHFACSAVFPSLPLTIKWLRDCVKENPSLRLQVLVTGSLHLVGDVLKLLRR